MVDRILENRLHHKLYRVATANLRINLERNFEFVLVAHLLDIHVVLRVLDLILDRNNILTAAQTDPKETRKLRYHEDRILVLLSLDHPDNRIERII